MKNSDYWKIRFRQLEESQNQKGAAAYLEIEKQYRRAQREIEGKLHAWYQRFASNNGISMAEARKMLLGTDLKEFKWEVQDYIKYGKENAINEKWMKELENASARFHISRLEALKLQTQQSLELMFGNQLDSVDFAMRQIYLGGYYHSIYEFQKRFQIGWNVAGLDQSQIEKVIKKPWAADGKNFSERIWSNKEKLISEVHKELTQNIILGQDPQKAIDVIAKKMNTSKYNAGRLVMTEEAYFSSAAQKDCFHDLDVEEYEIVATLDSHTSDICQNMDGKVFSMKDFEPGVTAPPFHVWCRSTTVPHFGNDFGQIGERAAQSKDGKNYYIPENITYKEWERTFVGNKNEAKFNMVNKDLALQSEKWKNQVEKTSNFDIMKLSEEELGALQKYKSFESYMINEALRTVDSIEELSSTQRSFVNKLDAALLKIPKYHGNLIRTIDFSDWSDCSEKIEKFVTEFVEGKIIKTDQYWSTSKKVGYNDTAGIRIYIQDSQKGRDISKVGIDEQEVLYERGIQFVVISKVLYDGVWNILLKEL